ncbi:nuclear protein localization protein 4 homolog isoform X1 [Diachasma alloeum]|uniref:nuclear protein localization protein 4 homolog isoform X1 n=2 Tax=Diachasma alloeum TaxID=454923 RepID=UPI00073818BA|nr:nuclear protein localization protein 4 homolog isoform X1 [Diachasma alloeum]XP_028982621.1 nuclear protein localization protein 4 homolog isoform X1 [Diachasma alloeum]XP_028982622.1 nuclear protein localization protein 4 homolog isoform X1 [Diachasma alloeum]
MSKSREITLRVQSPEGTKRIDVDPTDSLSQLFEKVYEAFQLNSFGFSLYKERNHKNEILSSKSKSIAACGLGHGDMLYLAPLNGAFLWNNSSSNTSAQNSTGSTDVTPMEVTPSTSRGTSGRPTVTARPLANVDEDEVDQQLWKMDGKIQRKRDEKLCRHGANGCCVHCSPLEPFDEAYLKEQNVKHLSFHSYLRKLTAGVDRGKFLQLEDISCRIKRGCKDHPPWPRGICSKCQPNAITLNRQPYRHIDNVVFENASLVERFLNYWRSTGHQRLGYLYGRYEIHADVPLGIRAVVAAIYEPPQESTRDSIVLLPDDTDTLVEEVARKLDLRRVGWIFTDLIADDVKRGTVKHVRNIESHFLTAQECIMAGHYQNQHPNPCRFSPSGSFGSKFVTVCVTGDDKNQVHMEGYQVSNQCMALVRDGCFVPTKDAPELGYVIESTDKQYVPDVYYKEKDSYGNEVSRLARPLPVEYLLVDVPASTPLTPQFTFYASENINPFPVENRLVDGQIQEFSSLCTYMQQFTSDQFMEAISDFHLLLFIATMDMLPMMEHMPELLEAIRTNDREKAAEWAKSEHWATVEQLISATTASSPISSQRTGFGGSGSRSSGSLAAGSGGMGVGVDTNVNASSNQPLWTCPHCTFLNPAEIGTCEMCSLPRMLL